MLDTSVDFQIFWNEISVPQDATAVPDWLPHYYFDPDRLSKLDPSFEWRGLAYFCAGVYHSRRNAIPFETWLGVEEMGSNEPGLFSFVDMGILNYLVHSLAQKSELKISMCDLQHLWVFHGREELIKDCRGCRWRFPRRIARPRIAHFCGRKPNVLDFHSYSRPFTIARIAHYTGAGHSLCRSVIKIFLEDLRIYSGKLKRRVRRCFSPAK